MRVIHASVLIFLLSFIPWHTLANNEFVNVESIRSISLDEIGLYDEDISGFHYRTYHHSSPRLVAMLYPLVPHQPQSKAITALKERLLLSITTFPTYKTKGKPYPFATTKLMHLARAGYSDAFDKMFQKIPSELITEDIHQIFITALFIDDKTTNACQLNQSLVEQYKTPFWRKILVYCQFTQHNKSAAQFSLTLLKEDNISLSKEYQTILEAFNKEQPDQKAIHQQFKSLLTQQVITLPQTPQSSTDIDWSFLIAPAQKVSSKWWDQFKTIPQDERFNHAAALYAYLFALEKTTSIKPWQALYLLAITHNKPIPDIITTTLLADATENQRTAEAALIILHAIGQKSPADHSPTLNQQIIRTLYHLGFDNEAKEFTKEALLQPTTP